MVGKKQKHRSDDFDEDAAKEFYSANKFVPPGPSELDKEKDKKRRSMATKLFKGRQKWKPGELSINSEQKLIELIHSNLDASQTEEEEDENLSTTELSATASSSTASSSTASSSSSSAMMPFVQTFEAPPSCESESASKNDTTSGVAEAPIKVRKRFSTSTEEKEMAEILSDEKLRLSLESVAERLSDDFMWVPAKNRQNDAMGEVESDGKITSKKRLSTRRRSSVFVLQKNDKENYELKADPPMSSLPELVAADPDFVESIREADSFFGPIGFDEKARQINDDKNNQNRISVPAKGGSSSTTASNRTAKRRSSVVKTLNVRRSSRFFRQGKNDSDEMIGSVFQEVTMEVKSFAGASAVSQPQEQPNLGPRNVASSLPTTKKRRSSASRILSAVENLEAT